ncbi:MAG: response regulator [Porticoccaceae bacterium]|nr:response regulator [Porticoccaceae bacterium]
MQKLKTIIVDDEQLSLDLLRVLVGEINDVQIIGEYCNGKEAVKAVNSLQPDLLFLDIQMPGMNGFDVIRSLDADTMPMVVFITAYDHYAVDAFDLHAVDYVLKPFDAERIARSIDRAVDRLRNDVDRNFKSPLIGAIEDIAERASKSVKAGAVKGDFPESMKRKLLVRDSGVVKIIPFDDIDWVDAAGDYMCVQVKGETHVIRSTLRDLMARLDGNQFVRIHRSTIVNLDRIASVTKRPKGGSILHLINGKLLRVSRHYSDSVRKFFT